MHIYIHLPFCTSRCIYCDFYVELRGTEDRQQAYLRALCEEITFYFSQTPPEKLTPIKTIYFGGGTPALFSAASLEKILATIKQFCSFEPDVEITMEVNPERQASSPQDYLAAGINRVSIGIQSFQPNELKRLARLHRGDDAKACFYNYRNAGFSNISIDLMYGIPEQTMASWQQTLREAIALQPQHISMYGLQLEEGTALHQLVSDKRITLPADESTVLYYNEAIHFFEKHGLPWYEFSNLAMPGYESRHNLAYWKNAEYWAFGVSAHGYLHGERYENIADLSAYLKQPAQCRQNIKPVSQSEQIENAFIFGLRLRQGVNLQHIQSRYHFDARKAVLSRLKPALDGGLATLKDDVLTLSTNAVPVSNEILVRFLGIADEVN